MGMESFGSRMIPEKSAEENNSGNTLDRREFLKNAAAGAGALAVGAEIEKAHAQEPRADIVDESFMATEFLPAVYGPGMNIGTVITMMKGKLGGDHAVVKYAQGVEKEIDAEKIKVIKDASRLSKKDARGLAAQFQEKHNRFKELRKPGLTAEQIVSGFTDVALDREAKKSVIEEYPDYKFAVSRVNAGAMLPSKAWEDIQKKLSDPNTEAAVIKRITQSLSGFPITPAAIQKKVRAEIELYSSYADLQKKLAAKKGK